jgi:hypothetical protein
MSSRYIASGNNHFTLVTPGSYYETHVEKIVLGNFETIFPDFLGGRCDPKFKTAAGNVQPDLVLIRRDGTGWALVEVEIEGHDVSGHILPQLTKLSYAEADQGNIEFIEGKLSPMIAPDLISSALASRPEVILLVHGSSSSYSEKLKTLNVQTIEVDIYCCPNVVDGPILVTRDGRSSLIQLNVIARRAGPQMPTLWSIHEFPVEKFAIQAEQIAVVVAGTSSFWGVTAQGDGLILRAPSNLPIDRFPDIADVSWERSSGALHLTPHL